MFQPRRLRKIGSQRRRNQELGSDTHSLAGHTHSSLDRAIGLQRSHRLSLVGSSYWTSTLTQTCSGWIELLDFNAHTDFLWLDRAIGSTLTQTFSGWIELLDFNAHTDFLWSDRAIGLQRSHRLALVGSSYCTSTLTQTFSGLDRAIGLQRLHNVDPFNQTQRSLLLICFPCLLPMEM